MEIVHSTRKPSLRVFFEIVQLIGEEKSVATIGRSRAGVEIE